MVDSAEDPLVRKRFILALVGSVTLAAVTAIVAIVIPAQRDQQHRTQQESAQRALSGLRLPAAFIAQDDRGKRNQICVDTPAQRCFVAPGDPKDNVSGVKAALAPLSSGHVTFDCQTSNPLPHSPVSCSVRARLQGGGALVVELFARPAQSGRSLSDRTYSGSYVAVRVYS